MKIVTVKERDWIHIAWLYRTKGHGLWWEATDRGMMCSSKNRMAGLEAVQVLRLGLVPQTGRASKLSISS